MGDRNWGILKSRKAHRVGVSPAATQQLRVLPGSSLSHTRLRQNPALRYLPAPARSAALPLPWLHSVSSSCFSQTTQSYICHSVFLFLYLKKHSLKGRVMETAREESELFSICWFIPQMPHMTQGQEPGTLGRAPRTNSPVLRQKCRVGESWDLTPAPLLDLLPLVPPRKP